MFPTNSERLIGISDAFSAFVYGYPSSWPHTQCTPTKAWLLCATAAGMDLYRQAMPVGLTECSPLDFRRSFIVKITAAESNPVMKNLTEQAFGFSSNILAWEKIPIMVIPVASDGGQMWGFERESCQQMGWCGPVGECLLSCFTGMPKVMTPLVTSPLESRCATSAASSADSGAMSTQTRSALSLARTSQQNRHSVSLRGWLQWHEWSSVCVCVCFDDSSYADDWSHGSQNRL